MKLTPLISAVLVLSGCSDSHSKPVDKSFDAQAVSEEQFDVSGLQSNRYRGYEEINYIIGSRFFNDDGFKLSHYIEETVDAGILAAFTTTLKDLLGTRFGIGLTSGFRNGSPNAVNASLWSLALSSLASDVKEICRAPEGKIGPFQSRAAFRHAALGLCNWPLSANARQAALKTYWHEMIHLDAPPEEREAWLAFAESFADKATTAEEVLYNLTFAALYNPHFLVNK